MSGIYIGFFVEDVALVSLANLRDILLPNINSGQLRVNLAERYPEVQP